ncbi:DUF2272 domain-containing protein [Entomobacter blattae]|uniref:DUF2272 domain-containing protein n=1 Tax=Entomobacter blattae TaxID=2762277 RepID=A0A7H1NQ07_9PROT|nr:DUF2272 domain-containing protein [Entomobacter blattae]QNT77867.1 hypothetical protein JGUZn3_06250 [Entomobacter blattae]
MSYWPLYKPFPFLALSALPLLWLTACGSDQSQQPLQQHSSSAAGQAQSYTEGHVPDFATRNFEPFNRQDAIAIAMREWRLFNQPVDDDDPRTRPEPTSPAVKAERAPGLWQRVGEYWWAGINPYDSQVSYTGKHDSDGRVFNFTNDTRYAWSAAFISYVMRIAGANERFAYSPNHSTYINAAFTGAASGLTGRSPREYAPQPGDLICVGRGASRNLQFENLPTSYDFPSHCGLVVAINQNGPPFGHQLSIIGGNVDDSVALTHVPTDTNGLLADPTTGMSYDSRYPWFAVLQVHYDANEEPYTDE